MGDKNTCDYIEIEKKLGSLEFISDFIKEMSLNIKLSFKKTWELMLVIDEICSNILSNSEGSEHPLKIIWKYDGKCVTVEIVDIGFPYNPLEPGGEEDDEIYMLGAMGAYMIEDMVDSAQYKRHDESNRVYITKYRRKSNGGKKNSGNNGGKNGGRNAQN